jgi:hypothetical protein
VCRHNAHVREPVFVHVKYGTQKALKAAIVNDCLHGLKEL